MRKEKKQLSVANVIHAPADETASFEEAMILTGYGRYNLLLLLVCGLIALSIGSQYGLSAYILPSAQCDLDLSSSQMGLINAAFLIGAVTGAILSGAVADAIGRRKILIWCILTDGTVALLSSLSQSFSVLFIFRCINGLAIGGPSTIMLSFLGEFHAEKSRAKAICYLGFFWTFAQVLLPALAWIIIPLKFNLVISGFVFNSWRLFLAIFSLPSLLGVFFLSKYPETPKFLLSQGQDEKALEIMRQIFVSNTRQEAQDYPVKTLISECPTSYDDTNALLATLKKMRGQLCLLFSPPLGKYTILMASILFTNMFGYYGLGLWIPELFNRFEVYHKSHPNVSITVCELAYLKRENISKPTAEEVFELSNKTWDFTMQTISILPNATTVQLSAASDNSTIEICDSSVDAKVFLSTIVIGVSCLLGSLANGYLANRWERRVMPIATSLISGICGCVIYVSRTSTQHLIVACVYSSLISMANIALYSVIVDVFPTNVNAMASSVSSIASRLGAILSNILFGLLLDVSCEVPIFLVGGVVVFGGLLGFLLPKNPLVLPKQSEEKLL